MNRRQTGAALLLGGALPLVLSVPNANAIGFQKELKKKRLTDDDYTMSSDFGLKYADLAEGKGSPIQKGDRVLVHFDVMYRGIDVVSSRSARLLGGNRTIAEPFEFIVGEPVQEQAARMMSDSAGGLFSGQGGPKPPQALSNAVLGMEKGGKRSIKVDDPALGYGSQRMGELPAGEPFELRIEVLNVFPKK